MSIICPTILANEPHAFRSQLERVEGFASRIQIDLGDGGFTTKTLGLNDIHWPVGMMADLHIMYKNPLDSIDKIIELKPHMAIVHKESDDDLIDFASRVQRQGIGFGVALLQGTEVEVAREEIYMANHVLIFSGSLGSFGGHVEPNMFHKIREVREINPSIEIGWDGGANDKNVATLAGAGIDVINVGGFIQKAEDPQEAYDILNSIVQGGTDV